MAEFVTLLASDVFIASVPPLMLIGPVKLSLPERVNVPRPIFVNPLVPLIGPAKVKLPPPDTVSVFDKLTALLKVYGPLVSAASAAAAGGERPRSERVVVANDQRPRVEIDSASEHVVAG